MGYSDKMFYILPHYAASMFVENNHGANVISVEREKFVDPSLCKNHLHLKFDDVDDSLITTFDETLKKKGMVYPEKAHIVEALNFDRDYPAHIIHCHAGISRSPAIGYALLRGRGFPAEEAMRLVMKIAPFALPNKRIVRLTDELFGTTTTTTTTTL